MARKNREDTTQMCIEAFKLLSKDYFTNDGQNWKDMSLSKSIRKLYSNRIWIQGTFINLPFGRSVIELYLSLSGWVGWAQGIKICLRQCLERWDKRCGSLQQTCLLRQAISEPIWNIEAYFFVHNFPCQTDDCLSPDRLGVLLTLILKVSSHVLCLWKYVFLLGVVKLSVRYTARLIFLVQLWMDDSCSSSCFKIDVF